MAQTDPTVEQIGPDAFQPPHCPRSDCPRHRPSDDQPFRFHRHAWYWRKNDRRRVVRYRCNACGKTFSQQAFAFSYYLKRPELSVPIAAGLHAGSAHRQLARSLGCAHSTVTLRAARLGRHALLFNAEARQFIRRIDEPIVFDHFETFEVTQDLPVGIGTAVGHRSWFVHDLEPAPHRRAGRMSAVQKSRMRALYKRIGIPPRNAYRSSFRHFLDRMLDLAGGGMELFSDGHADYRRALQRHSHRSAVSHQAFPNPKRGPKGSPRSLEAVRRDRAMFPVDLLHAILRHTCAHHRRETIAFGRRINALMERLHLAVVWRNWVKGRSERKPDPQTPAMVLGLADRPWTWTQVLRRRLFPSRIKVPEGWMKVYRREWITKAIGPNRPHALVNAF